MSMSQLVAGRLLRQRAASVRPSRVVLSSMVKRRAVLSTMVQQGQKTASWETKFLEATEGIDGAATHEDSAESLRRLVKTGLLRHTDLRDRPERFFSAHRLLARHAVTQGPGFWIRFTVHYKAPSSPQTAPSGVSVAHRHSPASFPRLAPGALAISTRPNDRYTTICAVRCHPPSLVSNTQSPLDSASDTFGGLGRRSLADGPPDPTLAARMYARLCTVGTVLAVGNEEQIAAMEQVQEQGLLGCFALTERLAGVQSGLLVETTAEYARAASRHLTYLCPSPALLPPPLPLKLPPLLTATPPPRDLDTP
jgi:hypothetical protein